MQKTQKTEYRFLRTPLACLAVALLGLWAGEAVAGTTGKVTGKISDAKTREPLPGVNVALEGTRMGAVTDAKGDYFILNVPAGDYTVTASLIGYNKSSKTGVRVEIDRTISLNFQLVQTAIQMEEMVVKAERDVIKMDVAGSQTTRTYEDVLRVVSRDFGEVLSLEPSVYRGQVRAGGTDETLVLMDGARMVDERLNMPYLGINSTSIQEYQVQTGGFNAEYGNLRSGLINVVTKSGRPGRYDLAVKYRYGPSVRKHFGAPAYGEGTWEWNTFAKSLDPVVDAAGRTVWQGWKEYSRRLLADTNPANDLTPEQAQALWVWQHRPLNYGDKPDQDLDATLVGTLPGLDNVSFLVSHRREINYFALPLSRDAYRENNSQFKLDYTGSRLKVAASGLIGKVKSLGYFSRGWYETGGSAYQDIGLIRDERPSYTSTNIGDSPSYGVGGDLTNQSSLTLVAPTSKYTNSIFSDSDRDYKQVGVKVSYFPSIKTTFDLSVERFDIKYRMGEPKNRDLTKQSRTVTISTGQQVTIQADEAPRGRLTANELDQANIYWVSLEGSSIARDTSDMKTTTVAANLSSQVTKRNFVKGGVEFVADDLKERSGQIVIYRAEAQFKGYTIKPRRLSAYLQDKLEIEGMIANFGVRLERLDPNAYMYFPDYPVNFFGNYANRPDWYNRLDPKYYSVADNIEAWFKAGKDEGGRDLAANGLTRTKAKVRTKLSPRLSVSFPVAENTKVYFNYGHFYTMPRTRHLFGFMTSSGVHLFGWMGNPNLEWARTILYEVGADQTIKNTFLFHVAGYVKDANNQIGFTRYRPIKQGGTSTTVSENKYYRNIRGLDMRAEKQVGRFVTGWLNFALDIASDGQVGFDDIYQDPRFPNVSNSPVQRKPDALPSVKFGIDLHTPDKWGPRWGSFYPLETWSLNYLQWWTRGSKATYDPKASGQRLDNVRWRDVKNTDLRISRQFRAGGLRPMLFIDVHNLFNRRILNTAPFGSGPGQVTFQQYLDSLHFPASAYEKAGAPAPGPTGNDKVGDWDKGYIKLPDRDRWALFLDPRTIFIGLNFDLSFKTK